MNLNSATESCLISTNTEAGVNVNAKPENCLGPLFRRTITPICREEPKPLESTHSKEIPKVVTQRSSSPFSFLSILFQHFIYHLTGKKPESFEPYERFYGHVLSNERKLHPHICGGEGGGLNDACSFATAIDDFIDSQGLELTPTETACLQAYAKNLHRATDILAATSEGEEHTELEENVYREIQALEPGESYIIAGGWNSHGVIYEIIRYKEDTFTLTIINTGGDEKNKEFRVNEGDDPTKFNGRYRHKGYEIRTVSKELVQALFPSRSNFSQEKEAALTRIDTACQNLDGKTKHGRLHYDQLRKNCSQKRLTSSLKGECRRILGADAGNYLHERFKLYYAERLRTEIDQIESETTSYELMAIYRVPNNEALESAISERKKASSEHIEHRQQRVQLRMLVNNYGLDMSREEIRRWETAKGEALSSREDIEVIHTLLSVRTLCEQEGMKIEDFLPENSTFTLDFVLNKLPLAVKTAIDEKNDNSLT